MFFMLYLMGILQIDNEVYSYPYIDTFNSHARTLPSNTLGFQINHKHNHLRNRCKQSFTNNIIKIWIPQLDECLVKLVVPRVINIVYKQYSVQVTCITYIMNILNIMHCCHHNQFG